MQALQPSFVSVTYGAGGSTRERTHDLIVRIQRETNLTAVSHLTCVCHSRDELAAILDRYAALGHREHPGPRRRPAPEPGRATTAPATPSSTPRSSCGSSARGPKLPDPRGFGIGVAGFPEGHPGTPNRLKEMDYLKRKVDAGADYICTQLFFNNRDFYDFRERCELAGIRVPILAGIMPITSREDMVRMAELALGARFPARLLRAVERCGDDPEAVAKVGVHWATEQCRDLLDNQVRGIHFYTLNRSDATRQIYENLGVKDSKALEAPTAILSSAVPMTTAELTQRLKAEALRLGFDRVGIAPAVSPPGYDHFLDWLEAGHARGHGLPADATPRSGRIPTALLEGVRSVVMVSLVYGEHVPEPSEPGRRARSRGTPAGSTITGPLGQARGAAGLAAQAMPRRPTAGPSPTPPRCSSATSPGWPGWAGSARTRC